MDSYLRFKNRWYIKTEKGGLWYYFRKFSDGRMKAVKCSIWFSILLEAVHSFRTKNANRGYFIAIAFCFVLIFTMPFLGWE